MSRIKSEPCKEVTEFKEKYKNEAEILVFDVFPKKIIDLQALFQSAELNLNRLKHFDAEVNIPVPEKVEGEPHAKRRKPGHNSDIIMNDVVGAPALAFPCGNIKSNNIIIKLIGMIKPQMRELVDNANMVKMWIAFLIPKIEDGNNFGVSIQEDTLSVTQQIESEVVADLEEISQYFVVRGKLVSKIAKYPQIDDYRQSVKELDEKEFVRLRLLCCELRNHYATLYDIILKNFDKIKKPRNLNSEHLY